MGDLSALKPQQPADETTKSIVDALAADVETGSSRAMYLAGKAYLTGNGVPANLEKGRILLDGAAQKGELEAELLLGTAYFAGKYLPQDRAKAAPYLQMAAMQGNAMAQYYVGAMYLHGAGLEKSPEKAMSYLERSGLWAIRQSSRPRPSCGDERSGLVLPTRRWSRKGPYEGHGSL